MPLSTVKPTDAQTNDALDYINANLRRMVGGKLEAEIKRDDLTPELARVEGETVVLFHLDGRKFKVSADDLREAKGKAAVKPTAHAQPRGSK